MLRQYTGGGEYNSVFYATAIGDCEIALNSPLLMGDYAQRTFRTYARRHAIPLPSALWFGFNRATGPDYDETEKVHRQ